VKIEVAYAGPEGQWLVALDVAEGTSALEAVLRSGIPGRLPGFDPTSARLGVFARPVGHDSRLREGDRVEIYRPLLADPKSARRSRAGGFRR
jgi:putative ubiquitin-RnfH superfamily antitoxin RatB of RatAB toxin-antitoxin module